MTLNNTHFYIVEDDKSLCHSLALLLGSYGFCSKIFSCAEDFLSEVQESASGCLIIDIHLPGLDGWELHRRLVESGSKRPVIFISADENGGFMNRAYQAGAVGYLLKPFTDHDLGNLLHLVPMAANAERR